MDHMQHETDDRRQRWAASSAPPAILEPLSLSDELQQVLGNLQVIEGQLERLETAKRRLESRREQLENLLAPPPVFVDQNPAGSGNSDFPV